ncbi:hypothetical protein KR018_008593 [Drosophila ironensis]|nr:hypothetical protein KR018_008593 [Drosophila ironensis]
MSIVSIGSGLYACYLFLTSVKGVSQLVKIVWATSAVFYTLCSVLLIIALLKEIRWLVYPYMCMLLIAIPVYTMIFDAIIERLAFALFAGVVISFVFLGIAMHIAKSPENQRRL